MAGLPLRTAIDHRLGEPLPHQPANRPQAPPKSPQLSSPKLPSRRDYAVLATVSRGYPPFQGRLPTCYAPVRHSPRRLPTEMNSHRFPFDLHVLSTPPAFILSQDQTLRIFAAVPQAYLLQPVHPTTTALLRKALLNSQAISLPNRPAPRLRQYAEQPEND